jgi:hypothetical protein
MFPAVTRMVAAALAAAALVGFVGCSMGPVEQDQSGDTGPPPRGLRIDLRTTTPVVKAGSDARFMAFFVNDGSDPVPVVLPGDGSEYGMRSPVVRWQPEWAGGRTGNFDSLRADEVRTLAPGERVEIKCHGGPVLPGPGTHWVRLEVEHVPDLKWESVTLGQDDSATLASIRRMPPFKAVSNVVEVTVRR